VRRSNVVSLKMLALLLSRLTAAASVERSKSQHLSVQAKNGFTADRTHTAGQLLPFATGSFPESDPPNSRQRSKVRTQPRHELASSFDFFAMLCVRIGRIDLSLHAFELRVFQLLTLESRTVCGDPKSCKPACIP
jgi:hypothetical protein